MSHVTRTQALNLVGQSIYAVRKDGAVISGKLVRVHGNQLVLEPADGKNVRTSAILPLALFDLLAIGTLPFAGFGFGFGGFDGFWW